MHWMQRWLIDNHNKEWKKTLELVNTEKSKQDGLGTGLIIHKSVTWEIHFITD